MSDKGEWYCPRCQAFVSAEAVTYEETHVVCGTTVTSDDTVITLAQENARLKAELAALKARTCATCKHWSRVSDNDFGVCGFWTDDRSTWHAYDDERCRNWQDKEAADA